MAIGRHEVLLPGIRGLSPHVRSESLVSQFPPLADTLLRSDISRIDPGYEFARKATRSSSNGLPTDEQRGC